jgi:iron(III) transport system substrate-binding protein
MSLKRATRRGGVLLIPAICLLAAARLWAANAPMSAAQLALYQGADREKILIEGAKKEGQLTFYNSHTWFRTFVKDFEQRYPFIKVSEWRRNHR